MNNTVNNAIKVKEAKEERKLSEARLNEQKRQFDQNYELSLAADNRQRENFDRLGLERKIGNDLLTQMRPESYQFVNDAGELGDPDSIRQTLTGPLSQAYIENIMAMDPDNKLSVQDKERIAAQVSKSHSTRVYDEMVGQMRNAGWDEDEIDRQIQAAGLGDAMDDFLLRGMGRNSDQDFYSTGVPDDLSNLESTLGGAGDISTYRHSDKKSDKNKQKLLVNAMDKFKKYAEANDSGWYDSIDEMKINQKSDGSWELIEEDWLNDSNFDISWDDSRPYIENWRGEGRSGKNRLYLDESNDYNNIWKALE